MVLLSGMTLDQVLAVYFIFGIILAMLWAGNDGQKASAIQLISGVLICVFLYPIIFICSFILAIKEIKKKIP